MIYNFFCISFNKRTPTHSQNVYIYENILLELVYILFASGVERALISNKFVSQLFLLRLVAMFLLASRLSGQLIVYSQGWVQWIILNQTLVRYNLAPALKMFSPIIYTM